MDLSLPPFWEERKPLLVDSFFYLPPNYDQHHLWNFSFFDAKQTVHIEYCSGNGQWILEKATKDPAIFWIAVEKKWERARKIWRKMRRRNLSNLLVVYGEASSFTCHYLPDASIQEVFVNFPDPWPKRRHAKNRLIQKVFVEELARVVKKEGKVTLVTDDIPYSDIMKQEMSLSANWRSCLPPPHYVTEWPGYGSSYFEDLWRSKGLSIRYLSFVNDRLLVPDKSPTISHVLS